jgi:ABC-type multidrug transport system permease subunit
VLTYLEKPRLARIIPLAYAYAIFVFTILLLDPSALFWTATFLIYYFPQFMVDGYNNHSGRCASR